MSLLTSFELLKCHKKFLLFLFTLSAILRLGALFFYFQYNACMIMFDAGHYHTLAQSLAHGFGFVGADGAAYLYRLPGYPFFLALCYFCVGVQPVIALAIQGLVGSLIPLLIFLLARILFPARLMVAYLSALIASVHAGYLIYANVLMAETLFCLFFLLFLILFFKKRPSLKPYDFNSNILSFKGVCYPREGGDPVPNILKKLIPDSPFGLSRMTTHQRNSSGIILSRFKEWFYKSLFLAGLMLGVASLIRPVGHYVLIVVLGLLLFECNYSWKNYLRSTCTIFAGWVVVAGWWLLRNYLLTGMMIFHTLSGPHFLNHSAVRLAMANHHLSYTQAKELVQKEADRELAAAQALQNEPLNEAQESGIMEKVAFHYFNQNWLNTFKHCFINIFKTTFSLYSSELLVIEQQGQLPAYDEHRSLTSMIKRFLCPEVKNSFVRFFIYFELAIWLIILFGFFGYGIRSLFYSVWFVNVIRLVPFILLFLVLSCACGFARLRLPIEHFFTMLAMAFWVDVLTIKK